MIIFKVFFNLLLRLCYFLLLLLQKIHVLYYQLNKVCCYQLTPHSAYTVTGSGGGGTHVYHYKENRALTNRERATLQTFPFTYNFVGGKESIRRQIGMAVPVLGAEKIMKAVKKALKIIKNEFLFITT